MAARVVLVGRSVGVWVAMYVRFVVPRLTVVTGGILWPAHFAVTTWFRVTSRCQACHLRLCRSAEL